MGHREKWSPLSLAIGALITLIAIAALVLGIVAIVRTTNGNGSTSISSVAGVPPFTSNGATTTTTTTTTTSGNLSPRYQFQSAGAGGNGPNSPPASGNTTGTVVANTFTLVAGNVRASATLPASMANATFAPLDAGTAEVFQQSETSVVCKGLLCFVGSNDMRLSPFTGDQWIGIDYSLNGGRTFPYYMPMAGDLADLSGTAPTPINGNPTGSDPQLVIDGNFLYSLIIAYSRTPKFADKPVGSQEGRQQITALAIARYDISNVSPSSAPVYLGMSIIFRGTLGLGVQPDYPMMAADGNGGVFVAWQLASGYAPVTNYKLRFSYSYDFGQTWSEPAPGTNFPAIQNRPDFMPTVAVRPTSADPRQTQVVVAYQTATTGPNNNFMTLWSLLSTNGGQLFGKPVVVMDKLQGFTVDVSIEPPFARHTASPLSAVFTSYGHVYLSFDAYSVDGAQAYGSEVYVIRSTTGGSSWEQNKLFKPTGAPRVGHQFFPRLAISQPGDLISVAYYDAAVDATTSCAFMGMPVCWSPSDYEVGFHYADIYYNQINASVALSTPTIGTAVALTSQPTNTSLAVRPRWTRPLEQVRPFTGDYIGIGSNGTHVLVSWTDTRDVNVDANVADRAYALDNGGVKDLGEVQTQIQSRSRDTNIYVQCIKVA